MNFNINIPGLETVKVKNIETQDERMVLHVELPLVHHTCPCCGEETKRVHDYRIQRITHLKWFERLTVIMYRKRRYVCGSCQKKFFEDNPFVDRYQRFSKEWNQAVHIRSIKGKTFKEIGEMYDASSSTVIRRFDRIAQEVIEKPKELPRVIAMDEYKGDTEAGMYQLIIANGETHEPIDILPNRRKSTIKHYLQQYGSQVEIVIMDMNPSFKAAVREALDRPLIIADRFHYCRYIYWAMDKVRRRIQKEWHAYDRKKCKRMRHVFYKDSTKLTEKQQWYLKRYIGFSSELGRAYDLKESYCRWFKQAKKDGPTAMGMTKESLQGFYEEVKKAEIPEFSRAIKTLQNWQPEILNSLAFHYSNGFLEGINNRTKVLKRNAYGFRSFERFRAKILLSSKYKEIGVHIG